MLPTPHSPGRLPAAAQLVSILLATTVQAAWGATASHGAPAASSAASASATARAGEPLPDTAQLQRWIEQSAATAWSGGRDAATAANAGPASAAASPMRVEVSVGRLEAAPKLAPCTRMEPFLPPNARLWGRTHVGVRCVDGASWSTYVPVTVSVFGPALVADQPLPAGAIADPQSFRIEEIDLTTVRGQPLSDAASLAGRTLVRPLGAGMVLRADDLRVPQTISAGDPVRIRLVGQGFTISSEGFAVAGAGEGQTLRVRTGQGKLLVGTVRERVVEVRL